MIYLDYAALTPASEEALKAFCDAVREYPANPNSAHPAGVQARAFLDSCTERIRQQLGAEGREVVYTSGASEANNLAIKGVAAHYKNYGRHIVATYMEHSSVNGALTALQNAGCEISYANSAPDGRVDLGHLKSLLRDDTILVSVCLVDSEVGVRQPIEEIGELLKDRPRCFFHVDAAQAVGKTPFSLDSIDLLTFAPYKFYGIPGCGALVKKPEILLEPLIHGGASATPYRSGTPALGLIAAAARALELAVADMPSHTAQVSALNRRLREALSAYPRLVVNSPKSAVPHTLNISLPGINTRRFLNEMGNRGVCLSEKSACCAPGTPSRPVYAMTHDKKRALSTLRISLSHLTTDAEIDAFLGHFGDVYKLLAK
jgi:cysteine desulfurase